MYKYAYNNCPKFVKIFILNNLVCEASTISTKIDFVIILDAIMIWWTQFHHGGIHLGIGLCEWYELDTLDVEWVLEDNVD